MRSAVLAAVAALLLAACPGDGDADQSPVATVTTPPPAPSPTPVAGPCGELGPGRDVPLRVLFVTTPDVGEAVGSPLRVEGCTNAFEATFSWELVAADGTLLTEGFDTATCGSGCLGTFSFAVTFAVDEETIATLRVFTLSPRDGSVEDLNALPLRLEP